MTKLSDPKTRSTSSILIILMGSLGDIARGLCLVDTLKKNLPGCRITWLVESKWAELVRLHEQIDNVIIFQRAWRLSAVRQLYRDLRQQQFDITLDLQRILKSGFFSLLSGAGRRIGFHRRNAKEFNWIFNNEHIEYFSDGLSKIRHYLKFTQYLGLPESDALALEFGFASPRLKEAAPRVIAELRRPFAAVLLGTSWDTKNWFFEGYLKLVRRILADLKLTVVLVGDGQRIGLAENLVENINAPDVINLVAKTSLPELTAVLKAAAVGIGPDSGPGHLAAAVGTPFVTLFGPTSPDRTAPYGCEGLVVKAEMDCAPCYKKRCPDRNKECMQRIDVDEVIKKMSLALSGIRDEGCY
ncbi:MAG: glycosyltransferase family 9 protein [Desulfobacterales bacterium]|nr:MAG: glycosyltransferase family 9 protein [Desulfobacterales bacterium]